MNQSISDVALYTKGETRFFAGLIFLISVVATTGWLLNIPVLNSVFPEWIAIQPNTIICFLLLAISLWLLPIKNRPTARRLIIGCITLTTLIALLAYLPFILALHFNLNEYIPGLKNVGKMSYLNALNLLIVCGGFGCLLGGRPQQTKAQYLFLLSLFMPMIIILGYFYNVTSFFKIPSYGSVSFISATLFLMVSFTALFSNPAQGFTRIFSRKTAGTKLAKYLIPGAILSPLLIGNFWLQGQLAGFYDLRMGIIFMVLLIIITLIPVIVACTVWLNSMEDQLILARQNAEAATRAKSAFLAAMSHEIRTPLNGVIGMTDLLTGTTLNAEQRSYTDIIRLSGEAVLHVINDILDFSKIESGHIDIEHIGFDLPKIIYEAIDVVSARAHQKGLRLRPLIDPATPQIINSDPVRISQVLINLLSNAIKFTEHGEVSIKVSPHTPGTLRFEVSDTGIGITPEVKARLFHSFSQGDASMTRKYGGTGLGLVISKRLVEAMGGQIDVKSTPNKGSTFWFTLPYLTTVEIQTERKTSDPLSLTTAQKQANILIAEDNDINQHVIQTMLKKLGFSQMHLVQNGLEALEEYEKNQYDLILMDCEMPEMDGYEATREICRRHTTHIPIIAMTAHALKGDREKCIEAGMNDYVSKPVVREDLVKVLSKWLSQN